MDYFFFSSMCQNMPGRAVMSYDVACQWARNLYLRALKYPAVLTTGFWAAILQYLVPKFHLNGHAFFCRTRYSFNFTRWVGRTDGEAPKRGWASTNALANSTKEMGPGSRRDTLDDHFGDYNWRKVTVMGEFSLRLILSSLADRTNSYHPPSENQGGSCSP